MRKPWSMHKRNGIYQTQLYDYKNKRYCTAKSTGTKDRNEALLIAYRRAMEFDSGIATEYTEWVKNVSMITLSHEKRPPNPDIATLVQSACQDAIAQALQGTQCSKNTQRPYSVSAAEYEDAPEEVKPLLDRLSTLTFYDYLLLYWNYDESPDIKERINKGETPPNPERFRQSTGVLKKYAAYIPSCPLTEITGAKIDIALGAIRNAGKLKEQTMKNISYIFIQPLHFAYRNNLLARDVAQHITPVSKNTRKKAKKEAVKAIFTKEEIQRLFNADDNPFHSETYRLINELLFKTGCRIGELQALQMQDVTKTEQGYVLKIDKNYCRAGKRIKSTKTERRDIVPIAADLAAKLLAHIEKSPFKDMPTAFVFSSAKSAHIPLCYESINKNFNKTMIKLGIKKTKLTIHSYRHTYATFLRLAGFSEEELKFLTRHDCIAEVRHYADHYTPEMERLKHRAISELDQIVA